MKKNLTKKLMLSVLTLAFAVVSLGASTFAWFTLSKDAEVKTFSANVTAGAGLELQILPSNAAATDPLKWQTATITTEQVNEVIGTVILSAVTPGFTDANLDAIDFNSTDASLLKFTGLDGTEKASGWIQFDLAFRLSDAQSTPIGLYLDDYSLSTSGTANWRANTKYYDGNGNLISLNANPGYLVSDAARLAIISKQKGSQTEDVNDIYYEVKTTNASGVNSSGQPNQEKSVDGNEYTTNAAVNYYNKVHENDVPSQLDVADAPQYTVNNTISSGTAGHKIGELSTGAEIRITVAVWVEGWDGECLNAIFSQTLQASLAFYLDVQEIQ